MDTQEKLCRSYGEKNGYVVASVYWDEGKSGTTVDRPALKDLLTKRQQDRSIAALIGGVSVEGNEDSLAAEHKTLEDFVSTVIPACAAVPRGSQALAEKAHQGTASAVRT